ncbi:MAG: helix-turn-helix transcriptional regulator [Patescibacteria group bacterium]|nr:helix-turn-helix transcriptional regulator [Patescibacteria group bacterium]
MCDVFDNLTKAERSVLQAIYEQRNISSAADSLFLSPFTVRTHLANIRKKMGVHSTLQAVILFAKNTALTTKQ